MTPRPPREGARWGEDPEPCEPEIPADYARLARQFGEPNLQKALEIVARFRIDFPSLPILQRGDFAFAEDILDFARRSMEEAAQDGRVHAMPKSLDVAAEVLPPLLVKAPELLSLEGYTLTYGDESRGLAAQAQAAERVASEKQARAEAVSEFGGVLIAIAAGLFAGFVASVIGVKSPPPWGIACMVTAAIFGADEIRKKKSD